MLNSAYNTFSHKNSHGSSQLVYILLPTRRQCSVSLFSSRSVLGNFLDSLRWFLPPGTHPLCNLPSLWAGTGLGNSLLMNRVERSNRMSLPRWGYKRSQLLFWPLSLSFWGKQTTTQWTALWSPWVMRQMSPASGNLRPANSHESKLENKSYFEMTSALAGILIVAF